jgi:hypothetical protein
VSYEVFVHEVKKQFDSLKEVTADLYATPPSLDLSKEVNEFCETLKYFDDDERERKLKSFIKPSVEHEVEQWQSQFSHSQSSLVRLHDLIDDVDNEKRNLEIEMSALSEEKIDRKTKQDSIEKKLGRVKNNYAGLKPVTAYSKLSYIIFIVGTLLIGILTAWYYLTTQLQIQFAQNPDIIPSEEFPGTLEFLSYKPENLIYGLGVVMFLLAGKLISTIYEKFDHNRIFFVTVAALCMATIFSSVYLVSSVSAQASKLEIINANEPDVDPIFGGNCQSSDASQLDECAATVKWQSDKDTVISSLTGTRFYMTIIILVGEVLLGAIAWMLASEYHEKRMGESNSLQRKRTLIEEDFKKSSQDISKIDDKLSHFNSLKSELETVASQLLSLKNSLPTREYIAKQKKILIEQQIQKGMSALLKQKHLWESDARSNN